MEDLVNKKFATKNNFVTIQDNIIQILITSFSLAMRYSRKEI